MADGRYTESGEPTQSRPRRVLSADAASVGQSTAAVGPSYTDPVPSSRTQHRASPMTMTTVPAYSDGLPYQEPKVVRRSLSRAVGWVASNSRRDSWRTRDKEKAKTLPFGKEHKTESLLSRLFRRNWSDNALQVRNSSGRTLSSVSSSLSSSVTRSGATFSNAAGSLTSSNSSICVGNERNSLNQPHGPAAAIEKRSCSEIALFQSAGTEPDPVIEFSGDISKFGSCRDIALEDNIDSGLASDSDTHLLRPHIQLPDAALDIGSHADGASLPSKEVVSPGDQVVRIVTQFRCSIENLTLQASQDGGSSSLTHKGGQRRHDSDPMNALAVGLHPQQKRKAHATQRVGKGTTRPLSLCVPVEWAAFGDNRSTDNLTADTCDSILNPNPGKGRLLATVSTLDIRNPPTSMKVVRASASYVDVHLISKLDTEDDEYRQVVVKWMYDTERSYLQALQTVIKVYMEPLQRHQGAVLEAETISDIFYQVPQICSFHETFVSQLCERRNNWQELQTIGDLFVSHFNSSSVIDMYTKFTSNFMNAKLTIQQMRTQRPSFARFLEQCARENREKLNLGDLLIKPIQRIPRYVLFIRDLLKHTVRSHPDHAHLELALEQLTALAEQINEAEKEASNVDKLRDLAVNIEGASQLLAPRRWLLRHDFVIELRGTQQKKDRCVFLFNDLILFATVRRKSSFRRNTLSVVPDFAGMRYKFLWQAPISVCSLSHLQTSWSPNRSRSGGMAQQMDQLQQDMATLAKIMELSQQLRVERQGLESVVRETLSRVSKKMDECKDLADQAVFNLETARLNLLVYSSRPPMPCSLVFMDNTTKRNWELAFLEAKKAAEVDLKSRRAASMRYSSAQLTLLNLEFLHSVDLQPGRMGMKLMCAGVGLPTVQGSDKSMWVCRGDSYGGQVCLLNVEETKKPNLVSSITVCNSEIRCIAMVPCGLHINASNSNSSFHLEAQSSDGEVQNRSEAGGEGPDTIRDGLETGGEGSEAEGGGEGSNRPQIEPPLHGSLLRDFGSKESISTLTPCELDAGVPPCSPIPQRSTKSHVALQEPHCAVELHVPDCSLTDPHEEHCGQSTREHSASHQSQFEVFSCHREETDNEPGDGDDILTPVEGICVATATLDSPGRERHRRDSWEGFEGTGSVPVVARGRSQSAPPDPLEVIKAELKGKSVTICEGPEEISVQPEPPRRSNTIPVRSRNCLSENGGQPFSPLTLKSVDRPAQVWLGTGEGSVYVFGVGDNLRSRKKCVVPLHSAICCIKYFDSCIYVGLENGSLAVFEMDEGGTWQLNSPHFLSLGSEAILCCEPVLGDLWIGLGNKMIILDTHMLTFQVLPALPSSSSHPITTIVCIDQGVWLSTEGSTLVYLYHAMSSKHLATVDITESVGNILSNVDPILRQHKLSCLRISSLVHVKSSLLIGTSAGVILLLPLPAIGPKSTAVTGALAPIALTEGHAGPISFVTSVALKSTRSDVLGSAHKPEAETSMLVFSGGDGFEDFLSSIPPEDITDSSSCINVWLG